jgi:3-hydroxybutyryl-CoA dehydrogenase
MTTVAVIGLGAMGLGIAQVYAAAGNTVLATDSNPTLRSLAPDRLAEGLAPRVAAGKLTPEARDQTLRRISVLPDLAALAPADLLIEAIIEDEAAKIRLFAELEAVIDPMAVLATNTSSLSVARLASGLRHPERVLGLHFFNPAPAMRLVELVAHAGTASPALEQACALTVAAGKTVVTCSDRPGFIVNRCARPYYGEALAMLEEGRTAAEIDGAMLAAGYRLGPFALIDLIGADVNLAATLGLYDALDRHPRYFPFDALKRRVASGHLGRKSGLGFLYPDQPAAAPQDAADIAFRIEATLVNEAGWVLAELGLTRKDIDTALRLGLNFPRGPFEILDVYGKADITAMLTALARNAPAHLVRRYDLAPALIR